MGVAGLWCEMRNVCGGGCCVLHTAECVMFTNSSPLTCELEFYLPPKRLLPVMLLSCLSLAKGVFNYAFENALTAFAYNTLSAADVSDVSFGRF